MEYVPDNYEKIVRPPARTETPGERYARQTRNATMTIMWIVIIFTVASVIGIGVIVHDLNTVSNSITPVSSASASCSQYMFGC